MARLSGRFSLGRAGVTSIEYALIAGLIAAVIVTAVGSVATPVVQMYAAAANAL